MTEGRIKGWVLVKICFSIRKTQREYTHTHTHTHKKKQITDEQ